MKKKMMALMMALVLVCNLLMIQMLPVSAANMTTSSAGISMIKGFEGLSLTAYKPLSSEVYYTIGYGHYGADVKAGMTITEAQAEQLLRSDLKKAEGYVNTFLTKYGISVSQNQFDALVSFTHNLGNVWVSEPTFKLKTYLINGVNNYSTADITTAFTNWCKAGGQTIQGLINRRTKEAQYFLAGQTPVERNIRMETWFSKEKMGDVADSICQDDGIYLCYRLYDEATGKAWNQLENASYKVKEIIYNPDGSVAYETTYDNSDENWIWIKTGANGEFRGRVELTGDRNGTCESKITVKAHKILFHAWFSTEKMGKEISGNVKSGTPIYLCYEIFDETTGKKLHEVGGFNYSFSAKETIYDPNGNVAHTYTYGDSSDNNWIGITPGQGGTYTGKVELIGTPNADYSCSVNIVNPATPSPTPTATPTPTPKSTPTSKPTPTPTPTPKVTPTPTPKVTSTPTPKVTLTPTPVPGEPVEKLQVAVLNAAGKAGSVVPVTVSLKNNPGISAITLNIDYDATVMQLQSIEDGKLLGGATLTTGQNLNARPYRMLWSTGTKDAKGEGTLVTLYFKLKEDVKDGTYPVNVIFEADDIFNTQLENVAAEAVNGSVTVTSYIHGDVNDDGKVNTKDATLITQYYAGWDVSLNMDAADVNADGKVNTKDATLITQYYAGWQVELK